jgi:hypothetical protein
MFAAIRPSIQCYCGMISSIRLQSITKAPVFEKLVNIPVAVVPADVLVVIELVRIKVLRRIVDPADVERIGRGRRRLPLPVRSGTIASPTLGLSLRSKGYS